MSEQHYTVVATYVARDGEADAVARLLVDLAAASRQEPANIGYTISRDLDDPNRFTIVESYVDAAGFTAHRVSEHFEAIGKQQIIPLLDTRAVRGYAGDGVIA